MLCHSQRTSDFFFYVPLYIVINLAQLSESAHFFIINSTRISCKLRSAISITWPIIRSGGTCRDVWDLSTFADKYLASLYSHSFEKIVIFLPLFYYVDCFEDTCRELYRYCMFKFSHCDHRVWPPWQPQIGRLQWMSSNCYYRTHTTSSLSWSITWLIFTSSFLCYVHWPAVRCSAPVQCNPCTT